MYEGNSEHNQGYERERLFTDVLFTIAGKVEGFKSNHLKEILRKIVPEFTKGLFEYRPYRRKLAYVGDKYCGNNEQKDDHHFFKIGAHYYSEAFNGGTYFIEGFTDGPIGCGYFEVVKDCSFDGVKKP